jgi:hypothetical protein
MVEGEELVGDAQEVFDPCQQPLHLGFPHRKDDASQPASGSTAQRQIT